MDIISNAIAFVVKFPFIVIGWIIVGAVAGDLARRFMKRPDRGCLSDFVLGIGGAIVGGFLAGLLGIDPDTSGLMAVLVSLVLAVVGAIVLIFISTALGGGGKKG